MPWIPAVYLVGYVIFIAWWVRRDLREQQPAWTILAELASDVCLVVAALGFWLASIRNILGNLALPIFVAGLAWFVVSTATEFKVHFQNEEFSLQQNIAVAYLSILLLTLVFGPLLYWGFLYAVRGTYGGI